LPETVGGDSADIRLLRLTPDEKRLVYAADAEVDELVELYALKPGGGQPLKLNQPFAAGRAGVIDFELTPNGKRVVYLADHAARARWELYTVLVDGGPVVKLSRPGTVPMNTNDYVFTPDGKQVVFVDKLGVLRELFVAPLDGGPHTRLSRAEGNVNAQSIRILPDSSRVVFQSLAGSFSYSLRSARLDGSEEPLALSGTMVNFGTVPCELSADGTRAVFGGMGGERNLLSVPVDGSAGPIALNGPLQPAQSVGIWNLTGDGQHALFPSNESGITQLYAAPVDGSAAATLLTDFVGGEFLIFPYFTGSAGRVSYLNKRTSAGPIGLESTPLSGAAAPTLLSGADQLALTFPDSVGGWGPLMRLTPDGTRALYLTSDAADLTSLKTVALDGSTAPRRIADLAPNDWIGAYVFFPLVGDRAIDLDLDAVSGRAVYRAGNVVTGTARLISVPLDGSEPARELTAPLPPEAEGARLFVTASRLRRVFYSSDALQPGVFELFSVPIDGSKPPRQLVDF
jgi:hypothetical protein